MGCELMLARVYAELVNFLNKTSLKLRKGLIA